MFRPASENDIKRTLEELIKAMDLKLPAAQMQEVIEKILKSLKENDVTLTQNDLKNKHVQNRLMNCITAVTLGKEKELPAIMNVLKTDEKNQPHIELDNKLKIDLKVLMVMDFVFSPEKNNKELSKDELKKLKGELGKTPKLTMENQVSQQELEKQLEDTLRNLYGGDNPRVSGSISFPVLGPVVGNVMGLTHQASADPNSVAEMVREISPSKDVDPLGLHHAEWLVEESDGIALSFSPTATPGH
jgi:hypothetical protein